MRSRANQTPFYRYGPQQGNGPDMQLPRDSIMKVIRPSFGYVKVQLQDGEDGYVASEDIRPAGAALVAEKLAPPPTGGADLRRTGRTISGSTRTTRVWSRRRSRCPRRSPMPQFRY